MKCRLFDQFITVPECMIQASLFFRSFEENCGIVELNTDTIDGILQRSGERLRHDDFANVFRMVCNYFDCVSPLEQTLKLQTPLPNPKSGENEKEYFQRCCGPELSETFSFLSNHITMSNLFLLVNVLHYLAIPVLLHNIMCKLASLSKMNEIDFYRQHPDIQFLF